jgi:hypothetical protein
MTNLNRQLVQQFGPPPTPTIKPTLWLPSHAEPWKVEIRYEPCEDEDGTEWCIEADFHYLNNEPCEDEELTPMQVNWQREGF